MLSQDRKNFLCLLLLLLLWTAGCCLFYHCSYQPLYQKQQTVIEANHALIDEAALFHENYPTARHSLKILKQKELLLAQKLPPGPELPQLMQSLNSDALTSQVEVVEIKPAEESTANNCRVQSLELKIQGNFFAIMNFLQKIHNSSRLIILNSGQIYTENDIIKTTLTLKFFAEKN